VSGGNYFGFFCAEQYIQIPRRIKNVPVGIILLPQRSHGPRRPCFDLGGLSSYGSKVPGRGYYLRPNGTYTVLAKALQTKSLREFLIKLKLAKLPTSKKSNANNQFHSSWLNFT